MLLRALFHSLFVVILMPEVGVALLRPTAHNQPFASKEPQSSNVRMASRSVIPDYYCNSFQRWVIARTLINALAWAELSAEKTRLAARYPQDMMILNYAFPRTGMTLNRRRLVERRFLAIAREIERWDQGQISLVCVSTMWEDCYVRRNQQPIVAYVESNMLALVNDSFNLPLATIVSRGRGPM